MMKLISYIIIYEMKYLYVIVCYYCKCPQALKVSFFFISQVFTFVKLIMGAYNIFYNLYVM